MPRRLTEEEKLQRKDDEILERVNDPKPVTGEEILFMGDPGNCPKLYRPEEAPKQFHGIRLSNTEKATWAAVYNKICYERIGSREHAGEIATWVIVQEWVKEGRWDQRSVEMQLEREAYYDTRDERKRRAGKLPKRGRSPMDAPIDENIDYRDEENLYYRYGDEKGLRNMRKGFYKDEFSDVMPEDYAGDPIAEDLLDQVLSGELTWKAYSPRNLRRSARRSVRRNSAAAAHLLSRSAARREAYAKSIQKLRKAGILP